VRKPLFITAIVALAASGCGGSDDNSSAPATIAYPQPSSAPATKKQYINQADTACAAFRQRLNGLPQPKTTKDVPELYKKIAVEAQRFYDAFHAIPKPAKERALLAAYEKNLRRSIAITNDAAAGLEARKTKQVEKLFTETKRLQAQDRRIASKYGFNVCGGTASGG